MRKKPESLSRPAKRESRLRFTDAEMEPALKERGPERKLTPEKPERKTAKAKKVLKKQNKRKEDAARETKERQKLKQRIIERQSAPKKKRLFFEDTDRIAESKLRHAIVAEDIPIELGKPRRRPPENPAPESVRLSEVLTETPLNAASGAVSQNSDTEDEDVSRESAQALEETAEAGGAFVGESVAGRGPRLPPKAPRGRTVSPKGNGVHAPPVSEADTPHADEPSDAPDAASPDGRATESVSPEKDEKRKRKDASKTETPAKDAKEKAKDAKAKGDKTGKGKADVAEKSTVTSGASLLWDAAVCALLETAHREIEKDEQDNVGVESAHRLEEAAETGGRFAERSAKARTLKERRTAVKAERRFDSAATDATRNNSQSASNPLSHWQQKRGIQKQYAAARRAERSAESASAAAKAGENVVKNAGRAVERTERAARSFVIRNRRVLCVCAVFFLLLSMIGGMMSSCAALTEGGLSVLSGSTFPSRDEDMLGAEAAYAAMEADLQDYLDNYESAHSYDEYHFNLDGIYHDPYVLISILTAYHKGEWKLDEARDTLAMLFERQYVLTENVVRETRYDSDDEPYSYYICHVTLENFDLSHLPVYIMDETQVSVYATYMACKGNRPDLFPEDEYPGVPRRGDSPRYEIPPEALSDARFAAMIHEAERYLGYPYVWGGSSPSTSFDCSGFVSWVINHSGWNVGRLGAQGLYNICTPVSPANARPGDLIFFTRTYNAPLPVTHVGIYVGERTMLHCGNPIRYSRCDTPYWSEHFYAYGRLP